MDFEEIKEPTNQFEMVGGFIESESENLQRSEEWFKKRSGNFTGSKIKDLMNCGRSSKNMDWGDINKILDFGKTSEKYIYATGMERNTGFRSQNVSSKQMQYGTDSEPLLIENLIKDGVIDSHIEEDYISHFEQKNLGASPDGRIFVKGKEKALEIKCTVSWDGHFSRMYEKVDEKHCDWWQFQTEMLVMRVDSLLYVVAYPMTVDKYEIQEIKASEIHQKAILKRVQIANKAIELWEENHYSEALKISIANFKN